VTGEIVFNFTGDAANVAASNVYIDTSTTQVPG
jgi:hypothetical protein